MCNKIFQEIRKISDILYPILYVHFINGKNKNTPLGKILKNYFKQEFNESII